MLNLTKEKLTKKLILASASLFLMLFVAILCVGCGPANSEYSAKVLIAGEEYSIENGSKIYPTQFSVEDPIKFQLLDKSGTFSIKYFDNSNAEGINVEGDSYVLDSINAGAYFTLTITDGDKAINAQYYLTDEDFPQIVTSGEGTANCEYYFTTSNKFDFESNTFSYALKLDSEGKVKYFLKVPNYILDFQKVITTDGKIRYLYFVSEPEKFNEENFGLDSLFVDSHVVVLDENYKFVKDIWYQMPDGSQYPVEMHDIVYLNDNHYIVATNTHILLTGDDIPQYMEGERNSNSCMKVVVCMLQEVKNGEVLWEFKSTDYTNLYAYYSKVLEFWGLSDQSVLKGWVDYMHINAMSIDESDGNLFVSFRNISAIIKLDRTTGELIWIMGGEGDQFNMEDSFGYQHAVMYLEEGKISIFDNTEGGGKNSRVIEVEYDEVTKQAEIVRQYDLGILCSACGSAQRIGDDVYAVCYGVNMDWSALIKEINISTGEVLFEIKIINCDSLYNVNVCS